MAQTLDLHGELQGLVVRNTFLDFSEEGLGLEQAPQRRTRAVSDLTDTKLPWKVPLNQDSSLFQITRHRFSSDDRMTLEDSLLESVSEEALEHHMAQSEAAEAASLAGRGLPWPSPGLPGAGLLGGPSPMMGFPGPGHPWWYGSAGAATPPWAQFPIWGYPPSFPAMMPQERFVASSATAARAAAAKGHGKADRGSAAGGHSSYKAHKLEDPKERMAKKAPQTLQKTEGREGREGKGSPFPLQAVGANVHSANGYANGALNAVSSFPPGQTSTTMTTVMLRNIPNKYSSELLVQLLDEKGFKAKYDFVYLPMDFQNKVNLGYAFVNLSNHAEALRFRETFQGFSGWKFESVKESDISWAHPHQGLAEHVDRYRNSPVMHPSMPDEYKPLIFQNGIRIMFPPPTRPIKAPKMRLNKERQAGPGKEF